MNSKDEMLGMIPFDLRISPQYIAIFDAIGRRMGRNSNDVDSVLDQTFIMSSTWGIEMLEREFGIEVDTSKPLSERRSVIISKKRGVGTVTVELVKSVAEAFYGGRVEVTEDFENASIIIKFTSNLGVPPNQNDVHNALADIIPAHLLLVFEYSYLLIRDVHNTMIINDLNGQTIDRFAWGDEEDG